MSKLDEKAFYATIPDNKLTQNINMIRVVKLSDAQQELKEMGIENLKLKHQRNIAHKEGFDSCLSQVADDKKIAYIVETEWSSDWDRIAKQQEQIQDLKEFIGKIILDLKNHYPSSDRLQENIEEFLSKLKEDD